MKKRAIDTRASMNGVDLRAFKRLRKSLAQNTVARLLLIAKFGEGVDPSFEQDCIAFSDALTEFDQKCADFIEYQSESPEAE